MINRIISSTSHSQIVPTTRRDILRSVAAVGAIATLGRSLPASAQATRRQEEALADPNFRLGANVFRPEQGERVVTGKICAAKGECTPVWNIAQWCSNFDLSHIKPEVMASGSLRYFDGAKEVIFGHPKTPEADLTLSVNGRTEYKDVFPAGPHTWPHLYVQQVFAPLPHLSEITSMPFHIETRLVTSDFLRDHSLGAGPQTAQFMFMLTVGNTNPASKGFKDSLWFTVPMYDARYELAPPMQMRDKGNAVKQGTNKFIYSAGGAAYSTVPASNGTWIEIKKDLLPLIKEALTAAWKAGYLGGSQDLADYGLLTAVMGWEVPGLVDVSMQVRNLSLKL